MSREDWAVKDKEDNVVMMTWYCPGCDRYHGVPILDTKGSQRWEFNEDWDAPTLKPSVLVNKSTSVGATVTDKYKHRCHVFIQDGHIRFLGDCTHHLAGKTVPLPKIDPWESTE